MCPPVPPQVKTTVHSYPPYSNLLSFCRETARISPIFKELNEKRRAAVGEERERNARRGQEVRHDTDVQEHLQGKMRCKPRRHQRAEAVTRVHCDPIAAHDQQHEQQNHHHRADKAQLLAEDGENVVVVLLRQIQIFLPALAEAETHQAAGADGVERLQDLIAVIRRVGGRVAPGGDAVARVAHALRDR